MKKPVLNPKHWNFRLAPNDVVLPIGDFKEWRREQRDSPSPLLRAGGRRRRGAASPGQVGLVAPYTVLF